MSEHDSTIVVSSRVRLARNYHDLPFCNLNNPDNAQLCVDRAKQALDAPQAEDQYHLYNLRDMTKMDQLSLMEQHLISRDLLQHSDVGAALVRQDEQVSVMVNEEDHLRIQALRPGLALRAAWGDANALDDALEQKLEYAFSSSLGYLTSCPTNVGTGMRASVMMHLPGLVLQNEMDPIANGLGKIGLTVRGRWGEGTAALGHMFQVSNQLTLGMAEERILSDLEEIVKEIAGHERNARERLKRERAAFTEDLAARAEGVAFPDLCVAILEAAHVG